MSSLLRFATIAIAAALPLLVPYAFSQPFPSKPVRLVVPYPPGGGADAFARIIGSKLNESWGQQVIIDNRGGGQGRGSVVPIVWKPEDFMIAVSGDPMRNSAYVFAHNGMCGYTVGKQILLPEDWERSARFESRPAQHPG